jgi:hypothetical protein
VAEAHSGISEEERKEVLSVQGTQCVNNTIMFEDKIYVPKQLRTELLQFLHKKTGHHGQVNFAIVIARSFWWQSLKRDVKSIVEACVPCALVKARHSRVNAPLHSNAVSARHQRTHYDLFGPINPPDRYGYRFVLALVDAFDGFTRFYPLRDKTALSVANVIVYKAIYPAVMRELASDDDPAFSGKVLAAITNHLGVRRIICAPHSQFANGMVERVFQQLGWFLKFLSAADRDHFSDFLDQAAYIRNSTPNRRTGVAPIEYDLAGETRSIADALAQPLEADEPEKKRRKNKASAKVSDEDVAREAIKCAIRVRQAMKLATMKANDVRETLQQQREKELQRREYEIGDFVVIFCPKQKQGLSKKFLLQWNGPFEIVARIASNVYQVKSLVAGPRQIRRVSFQNMRRYHGSREDIANFLKNQRNNGDEWNEFENDDENTVLKLMQKGELVAIASPEDGGKNTKEYWIAEILKISRRGGMSTLRIHYFGTTDRKDFRFQRAWTKQNEILLSAAKKPRRGFKAWTGDHQGMNDVYATGLTLDENGRLDDDSAAMLTGLTPVICGDDYKIIK